MEFEKWMEEVDEHLRDFIGVGSMDLPDQPWRDWFDDEMPANEAAAKALSNEEFFV